MAFKLEVTSKLPFFGRKAAAEETQVPKAQAKAGSASVKRLQLLIAALIALLAIDAVVVAVDTRQGTFGTIYIATVGKIRMLSQRVAKAAQARIEDLPLLSQDTLIAQYPVVVIW